MQLGLVEVNDVKVVVDHKGFAWVKKVSKTGQLYWEARKEKKRGAPKIYKGHCDMVKYLKQCVYHNYRRVGVSNGWITIRKDKKPKFVTVDMANDLGVVSSRRLERD